MAEGVLFVFFTFNKETTKDKSWTYPKFPKDWWWVGKGTTNPTRGPSKGYTYENEEQFMGPKDKRDDMKKILDKKFSKLKEDGIITKYKIRNSYLPS
jgi:hypothetical protein